MSFLDDDFRAPDPPPGPWCEVLAFWLLLTFLAVALVAVHRVFFS